MIPAIQKPLVEQQEAVALPDEALDFVRLSAAEHEQDILLERVDAKLPSDNGGQAVDALAQVGVAAGDVDPVKAGGIIQHAASPAAPAPASHGLRP